MPMTLDEEGQLLLAITRGQIDATPLLRPTRRRKPTLAQALRQAKNAGAKVARVEITGDKVTLVIGEPERQAVDDLDRELAEWEAGHGR